MINLFLGCVPDSGEFPDAFNGGGFSLEPSERPYRGVKVVLGGGKIVPEFLSSLGGLRPSTFVRDPIFDGFNNHVLNDGGGNRHSSRAASGWGATVNPVGAVACGRNNHSCVTGAAAKHSESGEEPVGFGFASATDFGSLNGVPQVPVDDGFVCVQVLEFPEVKFAQIHAGVEQARDSVVGPVDSIPGQVFTDLLEGGPIGALAERFLNDRGVVVGLKDSVGATGVSGNLNVPGGGSAGDGAGLTFGHASFDLSALVVGDESEEPGLEPLAVCGAGDFSGVEGEHATAGLFDSFQYFGLDSGGSEQPIEVRHNDGVGLSGFDGLEGGGESGPVVKGSSAGHVEFFVDGGEGDVFSVAPLGDSVGLFDRTDERFSFAASDSGHADYSDRSHCFNVPVFLRWVAKTVVLFFALGLAYMAGPDRAAAVPVKGDPVYQAWADGSLMPTPRFRVFVRDRRCEPLPSALGCARAKTIWSPLGKPISEWLFLHELGHVVHRQLLGWWRGDSERFADSYAWCSLFRIADLNPAHEFPGLAGWVSLDQARSDCFRVAWWIVRFR